MVVTHRLNKEGICGWSPLVHSADALGTMPWLRDRQLLGWNLARYVDHLAIERSLCVSMIRSCLAGIQLELLNRGLDPKMVASEQLRVLLAAIEWDIGKAQHRKHPVATVLLCQFAHLLPTAPAKVHMAWGPIVIVMWFLLHLGEIIPMATFDPHRQLMVGSASIHLGQMAPFAMIKLLRSKTDSAGRGVTLSVVCICSKVPLAICPVHTLLAMLRLGVAPVEAPLFIGPCGTPVVRAQVVSAIRWLAGQSGLLAAEFAGHSLHRGGATSALMAGASIPAIQALGRWRSDYSAGIWRRQIIT